MSAAWCAPARSGGTGKARLRNRTSSYDRRVLGMRDRPAGDLVLARKPHARSLAHMLQHPVEHPDRGRHAAHAIIRADQHHPPPLVSLLVKLVELVLEHLLVGGRGISAGERILEVVEVDGIR